MKLLEHLCLCVQTRKLLSKKTAGVTFYSDIFVQVVLPCGPGLQFAPCAALLREINGKK